MNPKYKEATEKFFRLRATGFREIIFGGYREFTEWTPKVNAYLVDGVWLRKHILPKTCESMTDWIKYVAEFMEGEGFKLDVRTVSNEVKFVAYKGTEWLASTKGQEIKDHEILLASVLAACDYLEAK